MSRYKFRVIKPTREQLDGYSPSELKTLLRRMGFKIRRDFFKLESIGLKYNRMYRFRWWNPIDSFVVDISEPEHMFDRWANSVERTIPFWEFMEEYNVFK